MILALLVLLALQAGAQNSGAVTGIVRSAAGAPAAGVRVYAQQVRDAADANSPTAPLEGLTQTDATGRYRLELPTGRYYIGSGAVSSPTYYPGTTNLSAARTVLITSGDVVEGIDFASFVAASSLPSFTPLPTGTLSGTVRYSDGAPAPGVYVWASPTSNVVPLGVPPPVSYRQFLGVTDINGRYRIISVQPDTYNIVAGFAEASSFHTGDPKATTPRSVKLTALANIDSLDVEIPRPAPRKGITVRGQVRTSDGKPAVGASVLIASPPYPIVAGLSVALPSAYAVPQSKTGLDGTFEFSEVVPGFYNARASSGSAEQYQTLEVANNPVTNLEFTLPIVPFAGSILTEDGSPVPNPALFSEALLTGANKNSPNFLVSWTLAISAERTFGTVLEEGDYQLYFRNVPQDYEIRSIKVGSVDVMNGKIHIDGKTSMNVEVRIGARTAASVRDLVKVTGTVNIPANLGYKPQRVDLCCAGDSTVSFSSSLRPDGSFEFPGVPSGTYAIDVYEDRILQVERATIVPTTDGAKIEVFMTLGGRRLAPVKIEVPKR